MHDPELLDVAHEISRDYLAGVAERHVGGGDAPGLRRALTDAGEDPATVLRELAADAEPGLTASVGPRYFGFVIGGSLPVAVAADWLVSAWDQMSFARASSPAVAVLEEVTAAWALDILGLPATASTGFVTGAQMANVTCLAAARDALLHRAGWDTAARGLFGAPEIEVVVGDEVHATVPAALRMLGLGEQRVTRVATDANGAMDPAALADALAGSDGPAIVCAQAGNVNTGACDPLDAIADVTTARGAWLHVDGAFGLWAAASPRFAPLVAGRERADSWALDAHKWLNVPYDCAFAIVADPEAHTRATALVAPYLALSAEREPNHYVPEASRRGPRAPGLRRAAHARPRRRRRARRALLRPRRADGRAAGRGRHGDPQRRDAQPGARRRAARATSRASRPTARAGSAEPSGAAARPCASRCPTGRPPRTTSAARRGDPRHPVTT